MSQIILQIVFIISGSITAWLILRMKNPFANLSIAAAKLLDTLLISQKSDDFSALLESHIKSAIRKLILFVLFLILIILPVILLFLSPIYQPDYFLSTCYLFGNFLPFIYISIFQKKKSDYNYLSQLLHRLVLDHYHIGKWLLSRQIRKITPESAKDQKSILITGLARAGTTALTKKLYENGNFASLDYSNMPFLLYTRLWSYVYKPRNKKEKERAHKDGINVGFSSVEALEEYFFKVISNDSYIKPSGLLPHQLNENTWKLYKMYQSSISKGRTYLAKNNNHIIRLGNLIQENNNTHVFILFREPLEHAASLLHQHVFFCLEQKNDPFILEYMNWLGHHEFGLNQKPFLFSDEHTDSIFSTESLEYWIEQWINYYLYALSFSEVTFISYEQFLTTPQSTLNLISIKTGDIINTNNLSLFSKQKKEIYCENERLLDKSKNIYADLLKRSQINLN